MTGFSARLADRGAALAGSPGLRAAARADDDVLAAVLIRMWSLASGRILRSDVRPDQLTEEELIRFWADDMASPPGRHAARQPALAGEAE
jgi:hypothetical protein